MCMQVYSLQKKFMQSGSKNEVRNLRGRTGASQRLLLRTTKLRTVSLAWRQLCCLSRASGVIVVVPGPSIVSRAFRSLRSWLFCSSCGWLRVLRCSFHQERLVFCEGCLVVRSDHGPQAEVAQGVGPGPLVEL